MRPVLVTAGATRNPVDAIRYLSAHATGRTGGRIAADLVAAGASVHLLASDEAALRAPAGPTVEIYGSTRDLEARMRAFLLRHPDAVVVHSAAVGDYEVQAEGGKIPSGQAEILLRLRPAPKILDQLKGWAPGCRVLSFKAAAPETSPAALVDIARRQLERTASDLVFANVIGGLDTSVCLVGRHESTPIADRGAAIATVVARLRAWL